MYGAIGHRAVGAAGVITANVVFEGRSRIDRERLVEQVATINPLTVAKL